MEKSLQNKTQPFDSTVICKKTLDLLFENYDPEPDGTYILTDELIGEVSEMLSKLRDQDGKIETDAPSGVTPVRYVPTLDSMGERKNLVRLMQLAETYAKVTLLEDYKAVPDLDLEKIESITDLDLGEFSLQSRILSLISSEVGDILLHKKIPTHRGDEP